MDVLYLEDAREVDERVMLACPSYDYRAQRWRGYSDHAHFDSDPGPLWFCGADRVTCRDA